MRFVPKPKIELKEVEMNPLSDDAVDLSYDEAYKQAILKAIASETSATVEYDQILSLEDKVSQRSLVDLFHDTIVDLRDEELKHLGQLTTKLSEVPEMKDALEAGAEEATSGKETPVETDKEEIEDSDDTDASDEEAKKESLTEAVLPNRQYSGESMVDYFAKYIQLTDEEVNYIEHWFEPGRDNFEPEEVDHGIMRIADRFGIASDIIDRIENDIINSADPQAREIAQNMDDAISDIDILEAVVAKLFSQEAKDKLNQVIDSLKMDNVDVKN